MPQDQKVTKREMRDVQKVTKLMKVEREDEREKKRKEKMNGRDKNEILSREGCVAPSSY